MTLNTIQKKNIEHTLSLIDFIKTERMGYVCETTDWLNTFTETLDDEVAKAIKINDPNYGKDTVREDIIQEFFIALMQDIMPDGTAFFDDNKMPCIHIRSYANSYVAGDIDLIDKKALLFAQSCQEKAEDAFNEEKKHLDEFVLVDGEYVSTQKPPIRKSTPKNRGAFLCLLTDASDLTYFVVRGDAPKTRQGPDRQNPPYDIMPAKLTPTTKNRGLP